MIMLKLKQYCLVTKLIDIKIKLNINSFHL